MLALLSITQNYGEFSKIKSATNTSSFSNTFFMPKENEVSDKDYPDETQKGSKIYIDSNRAGKIKAMGFGSKSKKISSRKMF
jgi:hypothetical protein